MGKYKTFNLQMNFNKGEMSMNMDYFGFKMRQFTGKTLMMKSLLLSIAIYQQTLPFLFKTLLNFKHIVTQEHAKKHQHSKCIFNFDMPLIDITMILEPLEDSANSLVDRAKQICYVF